MKMQEVIIIIIAVFAVMFVLVWLITFYNQHKHERNTVHMFGSNYVCDAVDDNDLSFTMKITPLDTNTNTEDLGKSYVIHYSYDIMSDINALLNNKKYTNVNDRINDYINGNTNDTFSVVVPNPDFDIRSDTPCCNKAFRDDPQTLILMNYITCETINRKLLSVYDDITKQLKEVHDSFAPIVIDADISKEAKSIYDAAYDMKELSSKLIDNKQYICYDDEKHELPPDIRIIKELYTNMLYSNHMDIIRYILSIFINNHKLNKVYERIYKTYTVKRNNSKSPHDIITDDPTNTAENTLNTVGQIYMLAIYNSLFDTGSKWYKVINGNSDRNLYSGEYNEALFNSFLNVSAANGNDVAMKSFMKTSALTAFKCIAMKKKLMEILVAKYNAVCNNDNISVNEFNTVKNASINYDIHFKQAPFIRKKLIGQQMIDYTNHRPESLAHNNDYSISKINMNKYPKKYTAHNNMNDNSMKTQTYNMQRLLDDIYITSSNISNARKWYNNHTLSNIMKVANGRSSILASAVVLDDKTHNYMLKNILAENKKYNCYIADVFPASVMVLSEYYAFDTILEQLFDNKTLDIELFNAAIRNATNKYISISTNKTSDKNIPGDVNEIRTYSLDFAKIDNIVPGEDDKYKASLVALNIEDIIKYIISDPLFEYIAYEHNILNRLHYVANYGNADGAASNNMHYM